MKAELEAGAVEAGREEAERIQAELEAIRAAAEEEADELRWQGDE
mgnify:FL=1